MFGGCVLEELRSLDLYEVCYARNGSSTGGKINTRDEMLERIIVIIMINNTWCWVERR